MKNPLARFRQAGSFVAGFLIGLSIMIPMFAMMATNLGNWQMVWVLGALIVLAVGLKLKALNTIKPRHRHTIALELGVLPVRFVELKFER
jgi:predicted tellurium resistance membrane protein TerC